MNSKAKVLVCAAIGALWLPLGEAVADNVDWKVTVEGGSEYDSNLHRIEVVEDQRVEGGSLLRTGLSAKMNWRPRKGQALSLDMRGATKVFATDIGQSENIGVAYIDSKYQRALGEGDAVFAVRGNYYNAIDIRPFGEGENPVTGRSFRTQEGELSLRLPSEGEHSIVVLANVRDFLYKPDGDFNWQGQHVGLGYQTVFWIGDPDKDDATSVDLRASYKVGVRDFEGAAFRNTCSGQEIQQPECFVPTSTKRSDMHHSGFVEAVYTGKSIYSLLYGAQYVDSNSYGQASIRQRVAAEITTELLAEIFLTAQVTLRLNTFIDPLLLAMDVQSQSFVSVEDENRNSLKLDFTRDIGDNLALEARLAIYSNEFATEELKFRRQTAYLGVVYRFADD